MKTPRAFLETATATLDAGEAEELARAAHRMTPARRAQIYERVVAVRGHRIPVYVVVTFPRANAAGEASPSCPKEK